MSIKRRWPIGQKERKKAFVRLRIFSDLKTREPSGNIRGVER
jgi:hypothetical protein